MQKAKKKLKFIVYISVAVMLVYVYPKQLFSQNKSENFLPKVVNNPIIQSLGVCDPHIHIFNNKAYLFASHDREPGAKFYGMYDWWIWSSADLVHWKLEFNLFPKDMWVGPTNNCWAVDGAERNGKYYFYVSGNWKTGVAVSNDGPGGPYKSTDIKTLGDKYDPTVFIDDDSIKTPYLITGSFPYKIGKLNNDMISLAEEQKDLLHSSIAWKGDGGFLHKQNGVYYLNGHGSDYSTATNIYGPYTYKGKFYKKWIDHPTFFSWNNQTYCAFGESDVDKFFRKTHITYVHYKNNGDVVADEEVGQSFIGVGQYDCSKKIQAEWYFAASNGIKKQETDSGFIVTNIKNNQYLYYQRMLNMGENAIANISVASPDSNGIIEIRQNKINGKLLGQIKVPNTGSLLSHQLLNTTLINKSGLANLYLVYKGNANSSISIDWLSLSADKSIGQPANPSPIIIAYNPPTNVPAKNAYQQMEAEDLLCYSVLRIGSTKDSGTFSKTVTNLKNDSYASYKLDFSNTNKDSLLFLARLSSLQNGKIEIRTNTSNGNLLGELEFENTKGLQNWVTEKCTIKAPKGEQHIFLVVKAKETGKYSNASQILNLNWILFKE
jgi:arabinoxylan arabinofuranohydrolase